MNRRELIPPVRDAILLGLGLASVALALAMSILHVLEASS